ncbi:MAG: hypothetical protein QOJ16_506 [Acidobacteriota bacterium]|jgi:hypothetical protein|nr:hypothetical protein [Acidobacteriota bacterium]
MANQQQQQAQPDMVYVEPPVNPPRGALASSVGSGVLGGAAGGVVTVPALLSLVWSVAASVGSGYPGAPAPDPVQNALGTTLLLGAIFLAGLALTLTAVSKRRYADPASQAAVPLSPIVSFCLLNLAGLTVYVLGLILLVNGKGGFHVAAITGAVLEILAVVVGVRRHVAVARMVRAQATGSATNRAAGSGY